MIKLEVVDPVWVQINDEAMEELMVVLSYDHFYWRKSFGRPEKVVQKMYCIEPGFKDAHLFHVGLLQRVIKHLDKKRIKYELINNAPEIFFEDINLPGVTLHKHQNRLVKKAVDSGRGVVIAPTGTGKSYILAGIASCFPDENILFLVHTTDLVKQMKEDTFEKFFPEEEIGVWTGTKKNLQRITVATHQSFVKVALDHVETFGVILIDEAHHVSDVTGNYGKILQFSMAHTKLGVTATEANSAKARWASEALLGPILDEYTSKEADDDDMLAKPKILMYPHSLGAEHCQVAEYKDKYRWGIVENHTRNIKIVELAIAQMKKGMVTLITIANIKHGHNIQEVFAQYGYDLDFVSGTTSSDDRDKLKENLKSKKVLGAIASVIFLEGIDIPALDTVINAGAGVSKVHTVQRIGRALRKTKDKKTATMIDFYDQTSATLERQSKARIKTYESKGWTVKRMGKF